MKKIALLVIAVFVILSVSVLFVSAAEENIALGKSYTYTGLAMDGDNKLYPDATPGRLTDGVLPGENDISYSSKVWIGLNQGGEGTTNVDGNPMNVVVLDLEEVKEDITKVVLFAQECGAGISKPIKVEVFKSDDNKKFSRVGSTKEAKTIASADESKPTHGIYTYTINKSFNARYVKLEIHHTSAWVFVSEVEVYAGGEVVEDSDDESDDPEESDDQEESDEPTESDVVIESDEPTESDKATESEESKADVSGTEVKEEGLDTWIIILIVVVALAVLGAVIGFAKKKK